VCLLVALWCGDLGLAMLFVANVTLEQQVQH